MTGFIDRARSLGQPYLAHQGGEVFYRDAIFYSAHDVQTLLRTPGFDRLDWVQTLSRPLFHAHEVGAIRTGYGTGAFVVVKAIRP